MRASPTKVFVINLDRHPDRLAHMQGQLEGVSFERFPAVEGAAIAEGASGSLLTRFEIACLASHQQVWRRLLDSADDKAIVLEDDLHLRPDFAALVRDDGWVPPDAHSVKLDTYFQKVLLGKSRPAFGKREAARLYSRHESSAAYLVSRSGAELYLRLTTPPRLPADYSIFPKNPRRLGLTIYQLVPAIAAQDHLRRPEEGGQVFATGMAGGRAERPRPGVLGRIGREARRLAGQTGDLAEKGYVSAFSGGRTATVGVE